MLTSFQASIMSAMEELLAVKFERVTEIKMNYDFMIKKLKADKHAEKIEALQLKKETTIEETKAKLDEERAKVVDSIK